MKKFLACMVLVVMAGAVMASTDLGVNVTFLVNKGFLQIQKAYGLLYSDITAANPGIGGLTQSVSTNPTALVMGSVTTPGYSFFRNLSGATNQIMLQLGVTNGQGGYVGVMQLRTGEVAVVRLAVPVNQLFVYLPATATTNTASIEYVIVDQ